MVAYFLTLISQKRIELEHKEAIYVELTCTNKFYKFKKDVETGVMLSNRCTF